MISRLRFRFLAVGLAFLVVACVTLAAPQLAWSAETTLGAARDATIYQSPPNNAAGGAAGIFSGTNGMGSVRRGLLAFDIAGSIPAGATVTAAELTLHLGGAAGDPDSIVGLHRLLAEWGEGSAGSSSLAVNGAGGGFAAAAGDATWNARFHSPTTPTLWATAGGDFVSIASATAIVGSSLGTSHTWHSTPSSISDVQAWLDNPAANFGWALVNANEIDRQTAKVFFSSEATQDSVGGPLDPAWRPSLRITYIIPEPGTATFLFLAVSLTVSTLRPSRRLCRAG